MDDEMEVGIGRWQYPFTNKISKNLPQNEK